MLPPNPGRVIPPGTAVPAGTPVESVIPAFAPEAVRTFRLKLGMGAAVGMAIGFVPGPGLKAGCPGIPAGALGVGGGTGVPAGIFGPLSLKFNVCSWPEFFTFTKKLTSSIEITSISPCRSPSRRI